MRTFVVALCVLLTLPCLAADDSNLGVVFDGRPKTTHDFSRLLKKAGHGDIGAQFRVGLAYETGSGVKQDYAEAVRWYLTSANHGDSSAQNNLGTLYLRGTGVPRDTSAALKWYMRAATQGLAAAENNLGAMYAHGTGVVRDDNAALMWYRKAAE